MKSNSVSRKRKYRPDRLEYLDQLVVEFQTTKSKDAKEQVLANLANFAYDPANYNYFRQLKILDLFIDNLSHQDENFIKFSIGGLCNLCLDPVNKRYIIKNGLNKIIELLEHNNEDIKISLITTLMFLITPDSKAEITSCDVIRSMSKISKEKNPRLGNLITIFLEDYCTKEHIKQASTCDITEIPCDSSENSGCLPAQDANNTYLTASLLINFVQQQRPQNKLSFGKRSLLIKSRQNP